MRLTTGLRTVPILVLVIVGLVAMPVAADTVTSLDPTDDVAADDGDDAGSDAHDEADADDGANPDADTADDVDADGGADPDADAADDAAVDLSTVEEPEDDEEAAVTLAQGGALGLRPSVAAAVGDAPNMLIQGSGWGHGVGMSQYGAYAQARAGRSVSDILTYYYRGTSLREARDIVGGDGADRRIRVGIQWGSPSTTIQVSGRVDVNACGEEGGAPVLNRLGHSSCESLGRLDASANVRICPRLDGLHVMPNTGRPTQDCALGEDDEPLFTTTRPVIRVLSHGTTITTPSAFGEDSPRSYSQGYRDYHRAVDNGSPRVHSVQDIPSVEAYLYGLDEVPSGWGQDAPAALQAQAITGRTFALSRPSYRTDCACQVRSTAADQVYNGDRKRTQPFGDLWVSAVDATKGRVLTYQGALAQTFYSSSHGGRSENIEDSWAYGDTPIPYLRSVDDPWSIHSSANNAYASWTAHVDNGQLAAFLSSGVSPSFTRIERIAVTSRTDGGTPRAVEVTGRTASAERIVRTFTGRPQDSKQIAGASMRSHLPVLSIGNGHSGGRLRSSQIQNFSFGPFTDDRGSIHEFAISWAAGADVVRGVTATRFEPREPVRRDQLASILYRTFAVPTSSTTGTFSDVPATATHREAIESLAAAGIIDGYDNGTFRPDRPVSRQQMASLLTRVLALESTTSGTFSDVPRGGTHAAAIEALAASGITTGCDRERFCPTVDVPRDQLASFILRAVER